MIGKMIQALLSKYLLPGVSILLLMAVAAAGIQSWRLDKQITENKTLETTVASYAKTIETMQGAEILGRATAKKAAADKEVRNKDLARHLNMIEGNPTDAHVDPMLTDTVKRLYKLR